MTKYTNAFGLAFMLVCLAASAGYAQQNSSNAGNTATGNAAASTAPPNHAEVVTPPSLGDIARHLKAQKAKDPKAAIMVTNDNIHALDKGSEIGVAPAPKDVKDVPAETSGTPVKGHDAEYYRARQGKLQEQLETHQRELGVLQQKLGQNNMQYYADPNKAMQQEYSRDDINKLTAEIDAKKQQVADDEKALEDLHDQLRQEGGDPSWLR